MKVKYWLGSGFITLYILFQFCLLSYSPLPWFDETFFADISLSFSQTGKLTPQVAIFREVKTYGPVYFTLVAAFYKIFDFGILTFRSVNFLFGICCVGMSLLWLYQITQKKSFGKYLFFTVLILTDPFFNLCWHEGRMDLTALFFTLSSFWAWEKSKSRALYFWLILGSALGTIAFLTTPRVGFLFLAWGIVQLFFIRQNFPKPLLHLTLFTGIIIVIYQIWIFTAFESYQEFFNYFTKPAQDIQRIAQTSEFLGGTGYIPRQEYPLIFSSVCLSILGFLKPKKTYQHPLIFTALLSIIFFYLMVNDFGQYSILILLFYYLIIGVFILKQEKCFSISSLLISGLFYKYVSKNYALSVQDFQLLHTSKDVIFVRCLTIGRVLIVVMI